MCALLSCYYLNECTPSLQNIFEYARRGSYTNRKMELAMNSLSSHTYPIQVCGKKTMAVSFLRVVLSVQWSRTLISLYHHCLLRTLNFSKGHIVSPPVVKLYNTSSAKIPDGKYFDF